MKNNETRRQFVKKGIAAGAGILGLSKLEISNAKSCRQSKVNNLSDDIAVEETKKIEDSPNAERGSLYQFDINGRKPLRERTEWCNIWIPDANKENLPRILLLGDSITQGYYGGVVPRLNGKAYCARLTTSACVCDPAFFLQLESTISQYHFAVIHFNNGLHGFDYSEDEYQEGFQRLVKVLRTRAQEANLICANSTPVKPGGNRTQLQPRIIRRNVIITEITRKYNIPINDLNKLMQNHPEYYRDDYHFLEGAVELQAEQVAKMILPYLHVKGPSKV